MSFIIFSVRLLSFWSFVFYIPATTANDLRLRRISIPDLIHYIIFLSYFLRKSQYFPFQCCMLNKSTTGTIFITSLVWRGPWMGIKPWTSHTQSQHSTTRLSRRWFKEFHVFKQKIKLELHNLNFRKYGRELLTSSQEWPPLVLPGVWLLCWWEVLQ